MKQKWIQRLLAFLMALMMVGGVLFSALPVSASSKTTTTKKEETVNGIKMAAVKGYPKIVFYDVDGEIIRVNGETELSIADKALSFNAYEMTYELSKSSRIKRNYSRYDLILCYADTSYPLIPGSKAGTYKNAPLKEGAKAYIHYDGYEFLCDDIEFGVTNNDYLLVKAFFNGMDFFNSYTDMMTVSFQYSRADGSSVSGGDDYHIVNLDTPDKVEIKDDDEDDEVYNDPYEDWTVEDDYLVDPENPDHKISLEEYKEFLKEMEQDKENSGTSQPGISPVDINASTPYVIVDEYSFAGGSTQVAAGMDFMLNLNCINTHSKIDLENIIMKVTTSDGLQLTSSSNTFFMDRLKRSDSFSKSLAISALSSAEAKSHTITVAFEYEYIADGARKQGKMSQDISIPVVQADRFSADPITNVAEMTVGEEIDIISKYMNKSRGQLYNLTAELTCDESINCDEKIIHGGNLQAGASGEMEFALSASMAGSYDCEILYTYEDAMGNAKETSVPFTVTFIEAPTYEWDQPVMEEFPMDDMMVDEFGNPIDPMAVEKGLSQNQILLIGGGVAVVVLAAVLIIRKRKKAKEFEDDDENF